ncbi:MAG: SufE family protein [Candidatus Melainabacteria bacterium]
MMTKTKPTPAKIQDEIVREFEALGDWEARYKHIIALGKALPPFSEEKQMPQNLVKGCQSQVWMTAELVDGSDGKVMHIDADSDAMIVRGLVALLLRVYSDQPPEVILQTKPEFFARIGMGEHLSMQRANGLFAMVKQIQMFATVFHLQAR